MNDRGSDIPSSSSTRRDIDRLERSKADKEATKVRLEELEKDVEEAKKIALAARKKTYEEHPCHQEERMKAVEQEASGWNKWFKGMVVVVISAVVVVGGSMAGLHYTKADASEVQAVKSDVTAIKRDVSDISDSQKRIETAMDPQTQIALEEERMIIIKRAMKEAVAEVKADIRADTQ